LNQSRYLLTETKLHPPLVHQDIIPRPSLLHELHSLIVTHPLTLLSAPAGYGKTTLLAALHSTYPHLPLAWLALDEEDNDAVRFLAATVVALQRMMPGSLKTAEFFLNGLASPGTEVRRIVGVLINDVLEAFPQPFGLLLDDLHLVDEQAVFDGLDYLIEHMPPKMHLVISSRHDPPLALARLRARGLLAEIRLTKLRFSAEEARMFLNDRLDLNLLPHEVDLLQSRTEGWAVGLRLLASSLDGVSVPEDREAYVKQLVQTDRSIYEFLVEEVFERQEPDVKKFMLETAILPELTASLCHAVTNRADAQEMLEELYRRNLFLVKADFLTKREPGVDQRPINSLKQVAEPVYRYHDLFADFLNSQLLQQMPDRVSVLHLRAAKAESDPGRAIGHLLAASSWKEAAEAIEQIGAEMFAWGYLDTLSRWIHTLPNHVRDKHPRLLHYLSNSAIWKGTSMEMHELLQRSLRGFQAVGDEAGQGEVLANLATIATLERDYDRSVRLFEEALAVSIPLNIRVQCLLGRAALLMEQGNWEDAGLDFDAAMGLIQQSGTLDLLDLVTFPFFDAGFAFLPGGLQHLEHICNQARELVGQEMSPLRLVIEEMAVVLNLFRGNLEGAIRYGEGALVIRERLGGHPFLGIEADLSMAVAHAALGNYAAVDPLLDSLLQGVELTNSPTVDVADIFFVIAHVRWLQGRLDELRKLYDQMSSADDPLVDTPTSRICRTWIWSLLAISDGRSAEAERVLRQPEVLEQKDRRSTMSGSTRLMLARLYLQQNRQQEALAELDLVLDYYEKLGVPLVILMEGRSIVPLLRLAVDSDIHEKYAAHLLDLLGVSGESEPFQLTFSGEKLTPREAEVLRLVIAGHSNQAIAEKLVISVWTVKSHLTQIYSKLDVASRTQAIARSRELGFA
jgi:LuxR family maltose regulon positive regulatory protein